MTIYHTIRYDNVEDYLEAKKEFLLAQDEVKKKQALGIVVNLDMDYPLPPQGYDDEVVVTAKGVWVK
jgi:hypothetical protein